MMEVELAEDPMSERKWVRKMLRWMRKELGTKGIKASISTIRKTLKGLKVSLKKNVNHKSTQNHPLPDTIECHMIC